MFSKVIKASIKGINSAKIFKISNKDRFKDLSLLFSTKNYFQNFLSDIIIEIDNNTSLEEGDIIRAEPALGIINILFSKNSNSNSLFLTEQCNNNCIMCCQPPIKTNDNWLFEDTLQIIRLIEPDTKELCITGGEPTLLRDKFITLLKACKDSLPSTQIHILTNGRNLSDKSFVSRIKEINNYKTSWGIPLFSDNYIDFNKISGIKGAYSETIKGIYNLAKLGECIEIRVIMQKYNIHRLFEISEFIYKNLPFVEHIAFMGLEDIGKAKKNHNKVWVNISQYKETIKNSIIYLKERGLNVSLYNIPLCMVDESLFIFCKKSISDWKNIYFSECAFCNKRNDCCGFFASSHILSYNEFIKPFGGFDE